MKVILLVPTLGRTYHRCPYCGQSNILDPKFQKCREKSTTTTKYKWSLTWDFPFFYKEKIETRWTGCQVFEAGFAHIHQKCKHCDRHWVRCQAGEEHEIMKKAEVNGVINEITNAVQENQD